MLIAIYWEVDDFSFVLVKPVFHIPLRPVSLVKCEDETAVYSE